MTTSTPRAPTTCSVCGKGFVPRMSYQEDGGRAYCSLPCRAGQTATQAVCDVCGTGFAVTFAYQASRRPDGTTRYACS